MIQAVETLAPTLGLAAACAAVGLPRGSFYRAQRPVCPRCGAPLERGGKARRALTTQHDQVLRLERE